MKTWPISTSKFRDTKERIMAFDWKRDDYLIFLVSFQNEHLLDNMAGQISLGCLLLVSVSLLLC